MTECYVIIDGVLQKRTPATRHWAERAGHAQPTKLESEPEIVPDLTDRRTDFEKINDLEEIE